MKELNMHKINKYIAVAKENANQFSKDPSSKVGALIIDSKGTIVSMGYNGFPRNIDDSQLSWERPMKYNYVIHAEMNALHFSSIKWLDNCTMITTHSPCHDCLKHMIHRGIRRVFYEDVSIVRDRATDEQKQAIKALIKASNTLVMSTCGTWYRDHI